MKTNTVFSLLLIATVVITILNLVVHMTGSTLHAEVNFATATIWLTTFLYRQAIKYDLLPD